MEELIAAEDLLVYLSTQYDTGSGRRVRDIIWSLHGDSHPVNLCDVLSCLDYATTEAVLAAIRARAVLGGDCEYVLRRILVRSGEMDRWNEAEAQTPQDRQVVYPPRR